MFAYRLASTADAAGWAVVTDRFLGLLGPEAGPEVAAELYRLLDAPATRMPEVLDALAAHDEVGRVAVIEVVEAGDRVFSVAVRGDVAVEMGGVTSSRLSGPGATNWISSEARGVAFLALALGADGEEEGPALPIRRGVVRTRSIAVDEAAIPSADLTPADDADAPTRQIPVQSVLERSASAPKPRKRKPSARVRAVLPDDAASPTAEPVEAPAEDAPARMAEPFGAPVEDAAARMAEPVEARVEAPFEDLVPRLTGPVEAAEGDPELRMAEPVEALVEDPSADAPSTGSGSRKEALIYLLPDGREVDASVPVVFGRRPWAGASEEPSVHVIAPSPNREISGVHLELAVIDGEVHARDLDSTNGTLVLTGSRPPRLLHHGGTTTVGSGDILDLGEAFRVVISARS